MPAAMAWPVWQRRNRPPGGLIANKPRPVATARRWRPSDSTTPVAAELPPLKLDKARFRTRIEPLAREAWGESGMDRVAFEVATNPGLPPGPLAKIASGGELSRFMLALKVVLAGPAGPHHRLRRSRQRHRRRRRGRRRRTPGPPGRRAAGSGGDPLAAGGGQGPPPLACR